MCIFVCLQIIRKTIYSMVRLFPFTHYESLINH